MRAVERALLLPEDRPRVLCEAALPRPGVRMLDPFLEENKRRGKKKKVVKKKGGKKKGGTSPAKKRASKGSAKAPPSSQKLGLALGLDPRG